MTALPRVLGPGDLPPAELSAARLDGELFGCGRGWIPSDAPAVSAERARAAALDLPARWVAEAGTAAWIWGARDLAPSPARFCVAPGDRGVKTRPGVRLRDVALRAIEWTTLDGVRVTTPSRTLGDLLRTAPWRADDLITALRLLDRLEGGAASIDRTRLSALPGGVTALRRLDGLSPR